jgi:hypothetical protein
MGEHRKRYIRYDQARHVFEDVQVVYDLAPGADLIFAWPLDADTQEALLDLLVMGTSKAHVISSCGFLADSLLFAPSTRQQSTPSSRPTPSNSRNDAPHRVL